MIEIDDFLDVLFLRVGKKLGKSQEQLDKFKFILRQNWYDTQESLLNMQDKVYNDLKIPMRLIQTIKQQLMAQKNLSINEQSIEPLKNMKTEHKNQQQSYSQEEYQKLDKKIFEFNHQSNQNGDSVQKMMYKTISLSGKLMQEYNDDKKVYAILKRLHKILENITKNIYEMKYRFLKVNNPIIIEVVCSNPCVVQFIESIGFDRQQQAWFMSEPNIEVLTFYEENIKIQMQNILGKKVCQAIIAQAALNNANQPRQLNEIPQLLTQQQLQSQYLRTLPRNRNKNQNKIINSHNQNRNQITNNPNIGNQYRRLQEQHIQIGYPALNSERQSLYSQNEQKKVDQTQQILKLISFRSSCLATPLSNRKERIYHKAKLYHIQASETCLKDIISYSQNSYRKYLNPELQFYRKGELFTLMNQVVYKQTCVRVQLPNEFIIEGWFGSCELLVNVLNWIRGIIEGDIYLYTAPPRKVMKKELNMALGALEAVPIGFFYLGINGKWLISMKYASKIEK